MKPKKLISIILTAVLAFSLCGCDAIGEFLNEDLEAAETDKSTVLSDEKLLVSHYIDAGQSDSEFIELPNGETMLIDAGTSNYGEKIADYITNLGYDEIDYLIATHPHADHIGGMKEIVESFDIGTVYMPKASTNTKTYENLLTAIQDKGLKIKTAKAGVTILEDGNLTIDILAPNSSKYDDLNNYSAVVKIVYKGNNFLYMGDAEKLSEDEITSDVSADVVKVGHHGSSSSSSKDFVEKVSPRYAIISVGEGNSYNHPNESVVKRWEDIGAEVFRTDKCGTTVITSDGENITVKTEK